MHNSRSGWTSRPISSLISLIQPFRGDSFASITPPGRFQVSLYTGLTINILPWVSKNRHPAPIIFFGKLAKYS